MGKYWYHRIFQQHPAIRSYLPTTSICTLSSLRDYMKKYNSVYIKPTDGSRGNGVIKAWKKGDKYYFVVVRGKRTSCRTILDLYKKLGLARKNKHIIQQAIQLATVKGRPFDCRVMMMRNEKGTWTHVGMVAKVAGKDSIITNVARSKGYVTTVDNALKESLGFSSQKVSQLKKKIIRLADHCNQVYSKYRYDWQIGYDIAVDKKGRVWLIEANPRYPSHVLFKKYQGMYGKIKKLSYYHRKKSPK